MKIQVKRAYDPDATQDGVRVLVDRLWPRGLTRAQLKMDLWLKDAAPGNDLRKWFAHDPSRWNEFKKRYFAELAEKPQIVKQLRDLAAKGRVTLLFAARDTEHNQAVALKEYLITKFRDTRRLLKQ